MSHETLLVDDCRLEEGILNCELNFKSLVFNTSQSLTQGIFICRWVGGRMAPLCVTSTVITPVNTEMKAIVHQKEAIHWNWWQNMLIKFVPNSASAKYAQRFIFSTFCYVTIHFVSHGSPHNIQSGQCEKTLEYFWSKCWTLSILVGTHKFSSATFKEVSFVNLYIYSSFWVHP